jgi:hypothetical protein
MPRLLNLVAEALCNPMDGFLDTGTFRDHPLTTFRTDIVEVEIDGKSGRPPEAQIQSGSAFEDQHRGQ